MAEESHTPEAAPQEVVVSDVLNTAAPEPESVDEPAIPPPEEPEKPAPEAVDEDQKIPEQPSFKEETNVVSDLPESQRKALDELKKLIEDALNKHEFTSPPPVVKEEEKKPEDSPIPEEKKTEETEDSPVPEEKKTEDSPVPEKTEEKTEESPVSDPVVEAEVVVEVEEKVNPTTATTTTTAVDEEKTVEAIAETIVSVQKTEEEPEKEADAPPPPPEEVFIWGIPLLGDERSDVVLLKFLRARDFKVKEALLMIKKCVRWRKEFEVDSLLEEDLGTDYEKVVFAHGSDKEGRPVVYNVFGEFKDKELYQSTFSDAEKQKKFLKWLVQFLERTIRKLDFSPTGVSSFVLVNDLKNSPGYGKREFYKIINKFFALLQDNYPEFVAKQVCINVSRWYLAYSWVYISVFTPRSKSKFVFASSSKTAETLFRYVAPEQVPVQYGGHSRAGEEFTTEDAITEVTIKPSSKHTIEFSFKEACSLVWELRVVGWESTYEAQFIPEEGYTVLVSKPRKMNVNDDPIICDTFKIGEPGKVVLTLDNHTSKKKKLLYRSKIKASE